MSIAGRRYAQEWLLFAACLLAAWAAFGGAAGGDFLEWDDDHNFLRNMAFRGLGTPQVAWAFGTFHLGVYQPLSWLLFSVEHRLFGLAPLGYHLTSLALFGGALAALYQLTLELLLAAQPEAFRAERGRYALGAAAALALFAVHPLRVEVVAWVSCQPYLPCALFYALACLAYVRAARVPQRLASGWYFASIGLFAVALGFKSLAVSLPLVLLLLDVYPLRRDRPLLARLVEKVPHLLLAGLFALLALLARGDATARPAEAATALARLLQAGYGVVFYVYKTLLPLRLSHFYAVVDADVPHLPFVAPALAALALIVVAQAVRPNRPWAWTTIWGYLVIVAPNLGLFRLGDYRAADRYAFLATAAFLPAIAAGFVRASRKKWAPLAALGTSLAIAGLVMASRAQVGVWRDGEALNRHALKVGGEAVAELHTNLFVALHAKGKLDEAFAHLERARGLKPRDALIRNDLGTFLLNRGDLDGGLAELSEAVRLAPGYADAHTNLGAALMRSGRRPEALAEYAKALASDPAQPQANFNLGIDRLAQSDFGAAESFLARAARHNPDDPLAHFYLAEALARRGRTAQARMALEAALRLKPDFTAARERLAALPQSR